MFVDILSVIRITSIIVVVRLILPLFAPLSVLTRQRVSSCIIIIIMIMLSSISRRPSRSAFIRVVGVNSPACIIVVCHHHHYRHHHHHHHRHHHHQHLSLLLPSTIDGCFAYYCFMTNWQCRHVNGCRALWCSHCSLGSGWSVGSMPHLMTFA